MVQLMFKSFSTYSTYNRWPIATTKLYLDMFHITAEASEAAIHLIESN